MSLTTVKKGNSMIFPKTIPAVIVACVFSAAAAHGATVFNFDNDSPGTATGFTDTVNGLSATFSSNGDPGGFVVYTSIFQTLTGNVLGDPGPAGQSGLTLSAGFNQNLSAVTLNFATSDFGTPSPLTLNAYENGTLVGSATATGQFLAGSIFPEGEIAFNAAAFNSLVLSSTAMDFAVDNITVAPATATPEPGSLALLALALTAIGFPATRKRRQGIKAKTQGA
jgi:hypothetical protein